MGMGIKKYLAVILSILLAASPALAQGGMGRTGAGGIGVPPPRAQEEGSTHSRAFTKLIFDAGAITYNGSHVHVTTSATSPALLNTYVPYIGANKAVDLGTQHISAKTVAAQHVVAVSGEMNQLKINRYIQYPSNAVNQHYTLVTNSVTPTGTPSEDGFRIQWDNDFTAPNNDYLVIDKTDGNSLIPDGGIAFTNTGSDGVRRLSGAINGNGQLDWWGSLVAHGSFESTHQHTSYDPLTSNGYTPWSIGSSNQHPESYAALIHQHDQYQPVGSYANATHVHPQYSSVSHQHSQYLTLNQQVPQHVLGKPIVEGIQFDTTPFAGAVSAGKLYWDTTYKTLSLNNDANVNLQIGQESMIRVVAGENLANGDVVYFSGSTGVFPTAMKAISSSVTAARVKGIATESITAGNEGLITNFGIIHDLNTNSFNTGDLVYLSASTAGAITATKPAPPNEQIVVGRVVVKDATVGSIYRSSSPNYPISSDQIDMQREATDEDATSKHSLQDWFNTYSVGEISGGTITAIGPSHVQVTAGTGISATGTLDTDPVAFIDWGFSQQTMTDQRVNWIAVDYNNGSPHVQVHVGTSATDYSVPTDINYQNVWPLGYVTKNGSELYLTNNPRKIQDAVGGLIRRFYQTLPLSRDEKLGGIILGETGTRNITLSAGKLWDRQNQFPISAINTSTGNVFSTWYRDGGTGFTETSNVTQWPNAAYDDGSGVLQPVASNRYANLWWYVSTEGYLAMVYGRAIYNSAAAASLGAAPSTLPLPLWAHFRLIGRTTFKGSDPTFTANDSVFNNTFNPSAATAHNNLSGLQGGTTNEYYHETAAQNTNVAAYAPSFPFFSSQTLLYSSHQHPLYAPISHQHPNYQAVGSYADASHIHPQYAPQSALTHMHDTYYAAKAYESTVNSLAQVALNNTHAVATASAAGFVLALPNDATKYWDGSGAYSTPAGSGTIGHTHPAYAPISIMSHQHPNYQAAGDYASGSHQHNNYYAGKGYETTVDSLAQVALNNTHANVSTSAAGFAPTLSNVATQFLNGQGGWTTPAGGGGGGSVIGSVPFQTLAAPQALQGIEQLRHQTQSYQNYGEIIIDGLIDQTGTRTPATTLTYTGSSNYDYAIAGGTTGFTSQYPPAQNNTYVTATSWSSNPCPPWQATDPAKSLTGGDIDTFWLSDNAPTNQRFHIDLGEAKVIGRVYYENAHSSGGYTTRGMKTFTFWGSNSATAFATTTYGTDTDWTQLTTSTSEMDQHIAADQADPKYFTVTNTTAYRYYAIKCSVNWGDSGGGGYMGVRRIELQSAPSNSEGYFHTQVFPTTITPTHAGVVLKLDSSFTSDQHTYLKCDVSRDGASFTDCHPITKVGSTGYYRAEMANVTGSGSTVTAKIKLSGSTSKKLQGYGLYAE